MTVYVDWLMNHGWRLHGVYVQSCHLITDQPDLRELHGIAASIGMKRSWFQLSRGSVPHYDLVASKRIAAIAAGAVAIDSRDGWRRCIRPIMDHYRRQHASGQPLQAS